MLQLIRKRLPRLSTAERKVGEWIIENPRSVLESTASHIATGAHVSEPTVIRFCRSLGYRGFGAFKLELAQSLAQAESRPGTAQIHADVQADDPVPDIIAKVMGRSIRELEGVQRALDAQTVESAARALAGAASIVFFGSGASGIVAADAENKFFRLGIPCSTFLDSPSQLQAAAIAHPEQALIALSKTGRASALTEASRLARERGATVIALTSPGSALSEAADITIPLDVDEDTGAFTPMSSRLAQLAVLDVVQVALALHLGEPALEIQERAKAILREFKA